MRNLMKICSIFIHVSKKYFVWCHAHRFPITHPTLFMFQTLGMIPHTQTHTHIHIKCCMWEMKRPVSQTKAAADSALKPPRFTFFLYFGSGCTQMLCKCTNFSSFFSFFFLILSDIFSFACLGKSSTIIGKYATPASLHNRACLYIYIYIVSRFLSMNHRHWQLSNGLHSLWAVLFTANMAHEANKQLSLRIRHVDTAISRKSI